MRKQVFNLFLGITVSVAALAQPQDQQQSYTFNLQQCIDYGIQNQFNYKNVELDANISKARVGEFRAAGLPQANITGQLLVTEKVQNQYAPATALTGSITPVLAPLYEATKVAPPPAAPANSVLALGFAVPYIGTGTLNVTQMIFDGSFLLGLKASNTLAELAKKNVQQSRIQLLEAVTKAFYLVLINKEREKVFDNNIARVDSLLRQTKAQFQSGFAESIDVSRVQVTYNNLLIEKSRFLMIQEVSLAALKFQMGMPQSYKLDLTGSINDIVIDNNAVNEPESFDYNSRIEYNILNIQRKVNELDYNNTKIGYAPRLSAFGNFGYNSGSYSLDLYNKTWNDFFNFGLTLNVPVFDGFAKLNRTQQAKLNMRKTENNLKSMQNTIDYQIKQADASYKNSISSLNAQKNNVDLSEQVAKVTRQKYQRGVGLNIEVINAESALKEAQVNYFNAMYDALISKVDYDKATGNLK